MFKFIDGRPTILTIEQVLEKYWLAYQAEFGEISYTQWQASYEYEPLYASAQLMIENGNLTLTAVEETLQLVADSNEQIERPAVLVSKVPDRFLEMGYEATIRPATALTAGIVAIAVDYIPDGGDEDFAIAKVIAEEMLPAGQFMEGDVTVPFTIGNGQVFDISWTAAIENTVVFRTTLTRDRNNPAPVHTTDEISAIFQTNYDATMSVGKDIVPAKYLTFADLPWASDIFTEYSLDGGTVWSSIPLEVEYQNKYLGSLPPANITFA